MRSQSCVMLVRAALMVGLALAGGLGAADSAMAQSLKDVQAPDTPLVLKAQGSFFVGGEKVEQTQGELGNLGPGGHIAVNQMSVRYMVPQGGDGNLPVVMVHGATLTGKSWETTPDGRMGWDEYFVRKGHAVYVPDQVGRGDRVQPGRLQRRARRLGAAASQPGCCASATRVPGPTSALVRRLVSPFPTVSFRSPPSMSWRSRVCPTSVSAAADAQPTIKALVGLAGQLKGAVVMGHSQSGSFPLAAALSIRRRRKAWFWSSLATARRLHRRADQGAGDGPHSDRLRRSPRYADRHSGAADVAGPVRRCQALIGRLKAAGGQAQMLSPTEIGIRGNSHMIMQDKNNLQIADLILKWIDDASARRLGGARHAPCAARWPHPDFAGGARPGDRAARPSPNGPRSAMRIIWSREQPAAVAPAGIGARGFQHARVAPRVGPPSGRRHRTARPRGRTVVNCSCTQQPGGRT